MPPTVANLLISRTRWYRNGRAVRRTRPGLVCRGPGCSPVIVAATGRAYRLLTSQRGSNGERAWSLGRRSVGCAVWNR